MLKLWPPQGTLGKSYYTLMHPGFQSQRLKAQRRRETDRIFAAIKATRLIRARGCDLGVASGIIWMVGFRR